MIGPLVRPFCALLDVPPALNTTQATVARARYDKKLILPPQGYGLLSLRLLEEPMMWSRLFGLVLIVVSVAVLGGQPQLASDIHPESLSRLSP
jgi:hypothetical protein